MAVLEDIINERLKTELVEFVEDGGERQEMIALYARTATEMQDIAASIVDGQHKVTDPLTTEALAAGDSHQSLDRIDAHDLEIRVGGLEVAGTPARAHAHVEHRFRTQPIDEEGRVVERLLVLVGDAHMVALVILGDIRVVAPLKRHLRVEAPVRSPLTRHPGRRYSAGRGGNFGPPDPRARLGRPATAAPLGLWRRVSCARRLSRGRTSSSTRNL